MLNVYDHDLTIQDFFNEFRLFDNDLCFAPCFPLVCFYSFSLSLVKVSVCLSDQMKVSFYISLFFQSPSIQVLFLLILYIKIVSLWFLWQKSSGVFVFGLLHNITYLENDILLHLSILLNILLFKSGLINWHEKK